MDLIDWIARVLERAADLPTERAAARYVEVALGDLDESYNGQVAAALMSGELPPDEEAGDASAGPGSYWVGVWWLGRERALVASVDHQGFRDWWVARADHVAELLSEADSIFDESDF